MSTATLNGKPQRKQLSDQLDRLDTIIDTLADALPEAVADATREGTRQAMREVLTELLTDPDVLARLRATLVPPTPAPVPPPPAEEPKPNFFARLKSSVRNGCRVIAKGASAAVGYVQSTITSAYSRTATRVSQAIITTRVLRTMLPMSRFFSIALSACIIVAILSYALPHTVSALISGVCGACTAMCVQIGAWFNRYAHSFGFADN